jgi:hypothetical protein
MDQPMHVSLVVLRRAVDKAGGPGRLAARLGVPAERVKSWLRRKDGLPEDVFLALVAYLDEV